jgi:hypothetical protein
LGNVKDEVEGSAGLPHGRSVKTLGLMIAGLLLLGGVALDVDRVAAARASLDRLASSAAIEAAASPRESDRHGICMKRFRSFMWTDRDVTLDGVSVSLDVEDGERYSTVHYDATVKLMVGRFFGLSEVEITGQQEVPAPAAGERVALVTP